jgi:hypothetical protein
MVGKLNPSIMEVSMRKLNKHDLVSISETMIRKQIKDWLKQSKNTIITEIRRTAKASLSRDMVMEIAEKVVSEQVSKTLRMFNIVEMLRADLKKKVHTKTERQKPDIDMATVDDMTDILYRSK